MKFYSHSLISRLHLVTSEEKLFSISFIGQGFSSNVNVNNVNVVYSGHALSFEIASLQACH